MDNEHNLASTGRVTRRQFMRGTAAAAGAALLTACAGAEAFQPEPVTGGMTRGSGVLVVYDSLYGNTAQIAAQIAAALENGADPVKLLHVDEAGPQDLAGVGLLLAGSPTHGGNFTDPVDSFLERIPADGLSGMIAAAFDTGYSADEEGAVIRFLIDKLGYASARLAKKLEKKGAQVAAAETFFVLGEEGPLMEGEVERAGIWAAGLFEQMLSTESG